MISSISSGTDLKKCLTAYARSLGFERVGITSAEPLKKEEAFLKTWIAEGRAGEMGYLEHDPARRARPAELLPRAKSVIALAMSYCNERTNERAEERKNRPVSLPVLRSPAPPLLQSEGRVSRYARGRDYHKVIGKKLEAFVRYVEALAPGVECRTFVDTGPLLERAFAQRAGLGFIGKNTMLITKALGSWVFLASVITTLDLPQDAPDDRSCGECRLCIDACPTQAITAPYELDARRCIAYLTIEHEGPIAEDLRRKTEGWIFGCDICQEVCPHNKFRAASPQPSPDGRPALPQFPIARGPASYAGGRHRSGEAEHINLSGILSIDSDDEFRRRFAGTAFMRAGRAGLVRNACLAAANLGRRDLLPQLEHLSKQDPHAVVREQAAWALQRLC